MGKSAISFTRRLIRAYQMFTSCMPARCRFAPSCSQYMIDALERRGFWKGLAAGLLRLGKCHPLHSGGYDPV